MNKHTPGPWFVTGQRTKYVEARIAGGMIQEVASIGPTDADSGYGPQQEANARLISAAPDLLGSLQAILDNCDLPDDYEQRALAAIAKATKSPD